MFEKPKPQQKKIRQALLIENKRGSDKQIILQSVFIFTPPAAAEPERAPASGVAQKNQRRAGIDLCIFDASEKHTYK